MIRLTCKQNEAFNIIDNYDRNSPLYLLMYGGSQSAKTSFACLYIQLSLIKYPRTTAIICRKSFVDLKATIVQNTFPKMLEMACNEDIASKSVVYNHAPPMSATFNNGSKAYFIGLEDNNNFEKILGRQASLFLIDEASEIGYRAYSKLTTRMSENSGARKIGFVTMNPTSIFHWCHKLFLEKKNPLDNKPLKNFDFFKSIQMNPHDNLDNLPKGYIENLENLSEAERERFLYGAFTLTSEGAVYEEQLKKAKDNAQIISNELYCDPLFPIYFSLDLGWDDYNASWIFQVLPKGVVFYRYIEAQHETIINFISQIREKIKEISKKNNDIIGVLPHDALQHSVQTGMNVKQLLNMHEAYHGENPIVYKILRLKSKFDGINVARTFFPKYYFDEIGCDNGLRRLGQYKDVLIKGDETFKRAPVHDASSHCADAFRYACVCVYGEKYRPEHEFREPGKMYADEILNDTTNQILNDY